jgi:hypothetical protein
MILAVGAVVIVTLAVAVTAEQPLVTGVVYVIVYVPAVLVLGVMSPVLELIDNPDGDEV